MRLYGQHTGPRDPVRLLGRRVLIVFLLILLVLLGRAVWNIYGKQRDAAENRVEAEAKLADLKTREAQLRESIAHLNNDRGVEEELRAQYELGRAGESLIVIVDEPAREAPQKPVFPSVEWFKSLWR